MSDLYRSTPKQDVPTREQIANRAYEIYENRGREPGRELEDWLAAESELRNQNAPRMPVSSPNSSNERGRTSFSSSRQKQSKTKTPSPSSFEDANPVDHQNSSSEF